MSGKGERDQILILLKSAERELIKCWYPTCGQSGKLHLYVGVDILQKYLGDIRVGNISIIESIFHMTP
jgi:hypothetical protein